MPRTDYDETWQKKPDGTMRLISRVERTVDDDQIAREQEPLLLAALFAKQDWTPADLELAVRTIIRRITPHEE